MNKLIKGGNLFLRKLEERDLIRTWEWLHRPEIYSKIGVRVPFTLADQEKWFENLKKDPNKIVFAVCRNMDNTHIGNLSLGMIDKCHKNARFSIFIADQKTRGKGYGTEALMLLEKYAFSTLELHKIWCKTDSGYPAIIRFYTNLGYQQEGEMREHEFKDGQFVDKIIFAKINI